ncbi:helix-turn-helix domain-containing protein [Mesorhizobium sp. M0800]
MSPQLAAAAEPHGAPRRQGALDLIGAFGLRETTGRGRYKG